MEWSIGEAYVSLGLRGSVAEPMRREADAVADAAEKIESSKQRASKPIGTPPTSPASTPTVQPKPTTSSGSQPPVGTPPVSSSPGATASNQVGAKPNPVTIPIPVSQPTAPVGTAPQAPTPTPATAPVAPPSQPPGKNPPPPSSPSSPVPSPGPGGPNQPPVGHRPNTNQSPVGPQPNPTTNQTTSSQQSGGNSQPTGSPPSQSPQSTGTNPPPGPKSTGSPTPAGPQPPAPPAPPAPPKVNRLQQMDAELTSISTPQGRMGLQAELTLSQQIRNVRLETANRWVANPLSKQLLTQELTLNRQITIERAKLARDYYRSSGGQASLREELKVAREIQNAREVAEKGKLGALADKTAGLRQQAVGTFFSTTAMASPVMTERFQQAVNDLSAVVGRTLLPWLEKLTDGIRSVADWFVGISPEGKKLIGNFIGIGTAILVAIPVISRLSTAATMASAALTSLAGTAGVTGGGRGGLIGSFIGAGVGGVVGHAVGGDNGALIGAAAGGLAPSLLGGMSKKALLGLGGVGVAAYGINELTNGGVEKVIGSVGNGVNALFRNTIGRLFMTGDDVKRANRRDWLGEKEKYGSISDSEKSELNRLRGEDKNKPSSFGASGFKADFMEIGQAARDLQVKLLTTGMDPNERTADNTAKLVSLMERQVNQVEKKEENKPAPIPRSGRGTGE